MSLAIFFILGGAVLEDGDGIHLVQKYSPLTDSWTEMPPMRIPRSGAAACSLGDYIYVVGMLHTLILSIIQYNLINKCHCVQLGFFLFKRYFNFRIRNNVS